MTQDTQLCLLIGRGVCRSLSEILHYKLL